ncbi:MAG TPA: glycoside hydrolase family 43 protein [Flavisolibacter sp.]|nr:glycoside hydrolase family 43 protein [Flavisolibacter sp.]
MKKNKYTMNQLKRISLPLVATVMIAGCAENNTSQTKAASETDSTSGKKKEYLSQPLVTHIYTADPSAHVFNGRIYIYPSHDTSTGTPEDDLGSHFDMRDYHILSMDSVGGKVTDHGVALDIRNIPWAGRQLWAPDAAFASNTYYLYFPVKDKKDVFHIGVATSNKPEGPFTPEKEPIKGSYSIDPCVFKDDDGSFYMYFGGIWGGQLQRWNNNQYDSSKGNRKPEDPAILPRVAKLSADMKNFAGPVKEIQILGKDGKPFHEKDNDKRFFEGSWMFKKDGKYYFTYSTGDTHYLVYATGPSPYGPFTYQGIILNPVEGWTTHHSIIEKDGKWWLFYHDTQLSGKTHLRNVKVTELKFNPDGSIQTITAQK